MSGPAPNVEVDLSSYQYEDDPKARELVGYLTLAQMIENVSHFSDDPTLTMSDADKAAWYYLHPEHRPCDIW